MGGVDGERHQVFIVNRHRALERAMRMPIVKLNATSQSLLFALAGVLVFVYWMVARPSAAMTASQSEWPHVLWFSGTLLSLAVALPEFGRMLGGRWVVRLASIAGAGIGLSSVANIFEDGFRIEEFFFVFILGTLILDVTLLALSIVIARTFPGRHRLFALIPAGTLAGILLFVAAGGPIMLVTWLAAAAAAVTSGWGPIREAPTTP
jgi:hypothetical protein